MLPIINQKFFFSTARFTHLIVQFISKQYQPYLLNASDVHPTFHNVQSADTKPDKPFVDSTNGILLMKMLLYDNSIGGSVLKGFLDNEKQKQLSLVGWLV